MTHYPARVARAGDILLGTMDVNDEKESFITITQIDIITNTVEGFFEIYFISEDKTKKLDIKDGEYDVSLYK